MIKCKWGCILIGYEEFEELVVNVLKRDISSNEDQNLAISSDMGQSLFIVAGPGSGKTTVMVLKILKFIFVDDVSPNEILATTFTKKAANELLSRILQWGSEIKSAVIALYMDKLFSGEEIDERLIKRIGKIDFNQVNVGTIDSIAEELLRVYRKAGVTQPTLIEDFVANSVMINDCLLKDDRYKNEALQEYLAEITGKEQKTHEKPKIRNLTMMADILINIKEVCYYNMVEIKDILKDVSPKETGRHMALNLILEYIEVLKTKNICDFAMLETEFFNRLDSGDLNVFQSEIKIVLIDEYQDTNFLQERIYFKIAQSAHDNGGSITVVGDDDQSLYRFRRASVYLFTNFIERIGELGIDVIEVNLKTNYRSTENIIDLCNDFVELDERYQSARVNEKPKIEFPTRFDEEGSESASIDAGSDEGSGNESNPIPILGMFRNNEQMLAKDLAKFIDELNRNRVVKRKVKRVLSKEDNRKLNSDNKTTLLNYRDSGFDLAKEKNEIEIRLDENGSIEDIAFLTYSPKEITSMGGRTFPYALKRILAKMRHPIEVFNPRGQDLQNIDEVSILCGLMLECIDPNSRCQRANDKIPNSAGRNMGIWRRKAISYMKDVNPEPLSPVSLERFVTHWQLRRPFSSDDARDMKWPENAGLIELAYKLVTWIPKFNEDDEGVVYLKVITQTINQTNFFNKYSAKIDFSSAEAEEESINEALLNIFVPIATGRVDIDENLFEVIPPERFNIMSIHQSKGLEFPLVIVDVGSRFKKNIDRESFLRFPKHPSSSTIIQERVEKYSSFSVDRDNIDCAFDDLTRLYFVAFSRAKDVLLLVGLNPNIDGYSQKDKHMTIPNVALGWNRDEEFIGFDNIYLI